MPQNCWQFVHFVYGEKALYTSTGKSPLVYGKHLFKSQTLLKLFICLNSYEMYIVQQGGVIQHFLRFSKSYYFSLLCKTSVHYLARLLIIILQDFCYYLARLLFILLQDYFSLSCKTTSHYFARLLFITFQDYFSSSCKTTFHYFARPLFITLQDYFSLPCKTTFHYIARLLFITM